MGTSSQHISIRSSTACSARCPTASRVLRGGTLGRNEGLPPFSTRWITTMGHCKAENLTGLRNIQPVTSVKRRKLKWYGHVTRSSGLAKTILQGTVQGGRRRGRQRKRWEDSIKEWTGLEWNIPLRKAENRKEWRKMVVKSTVVPQRSARLRDR